MAPLEPMDRGTTACRAAAWAITVRIRWSARTCAHPSLRARSGVLHRSSRIGIAAWIDRRSSSALHRARYSAARSSVVVCRGPSSVATTTTDRARKPGWRVRTLASRTAIDSGDARYASRPSDRTDAGWAQRTTWSPAPSRRPRRKSAVR
jgi:hypothetical protein